MGFLGFLGFWKIPRDYPMRKNPGFLQCKSSSPSSNLELLLLLLVIKFRLLLLFPVATVDCMFSSQTQVEKFDSW